MNTGLFYSMEKNQSSLKWILIIALALVWGSSFILMKKALVDFLPEQVASIRMFFSFLFLIPFAWNKLKTIRSDQWKYMVGTGLLGNGIPAFLFSFAQTKIPSFLAGMLNSLTPLFTMLLGYVVFRHKQGWIRVMGVLTGLGGAIWLILLSADGKVENVTWYPLLVVLATLCYAGSVNIIRHKLHDADSMIIAAGALTAVGPILGIYLFTTDFVERLTTLPGAWLSFAFVLILALFGTTLSLIVFNRLIKISGALFASSVTYLIPIVAMLWGLFDGEALHFLHVAALVAVLGGVYMISRDGSR